MTHMRIQVLQEPTGIPVSNQTVRLRRRADGATLAAGLTDEDGLVAYLTDGHPGPFILALEDIPGGDKYWSDVEATGAGPLSLPEIPYALRILGDGVIANFLDGLVPSASGSSTVALAAGACLCGGVPVMNYQADTWPVSRPSTDTRIDRIVCRVSPTTSTLPGLAEFGMLVGTEGSGIAPALTQSDEAYEIGLGTVTVPVVAPITVSDSRSFAGQASAPVMAVARSATSSTTNASGASLFSATLDLTRSATYDVTAEVVGIQDTDTIIPAVPGSWSLSATYGSTGSGSTNYNTPAQIAIDASDNVFVADTVNNAVKQRDSSGAYVAFWGVTSPTGIDLDSSGNLYVACASTYVLKFPPTPTGAGIFSTWQTNTGSTVRHCCTDGTYLYTTAGSTVKKHNMSTGALVTTYGSAGSTDGKYNTPYGICTDGTHFWVADSGNSRVQKITTSGVYVSQFATSAGMRGIALDASGNLVVAFNSANLVRRYTSAGVLIDSFTATAPDGVGVGSDNRIWVTDATNDTLSVFTYTAGTPSSGATGYGQVAVSINAVVGTYTGIGNVDGTLANASTATISGPASVTVAAYGKATSGTVSLTNAVLAARATPRS